MGALNFINAPYKIGDRTFVLLPDRTGFWLVLTEKSNSGFPVVNPAYGDRTTTNGSVASQR